MIAPQSFPVTGAEAIVNIKLLKALSNSGLFEIDLVLRNNFTTKEKPYGLYHPDVDLHHVKKENIGLIEVMGLAILPGRLKEELNILEEIINKQRKETDIELIEKHKEWYYQIKDKENIDLEEELGKKFVAVLESCQVFKYGTINDVIDFINRLE